MMGSVVHCVQMTITIRPANSSDAAAVLSLAHRLEEGVAPWREQSAVAAAVRSWVESALGQIENDSSAMFVATGGASVVGFVTAEEKRHWAGAIDTYIGELVVAVPAQGMGVGRCLVAAAIDWGRGRGHKRVTVQTGAANSGARAFYAALGFEEEDITLSYGLD